jgi:hypothetical protein
MNIFDSFTKIVTDTASLASETVIKTAVAAGETISNAASVTGQAVAQTVTGVGEVIGGAAEQASQTVVTTALGTGEVIGTAAKEAGNAVVKIATKTSSEALSLAMNQVLQDCTIPVFLLPTGSSNQSFKCVFLDEAIANLSDGILVRLQVQVWAGRADIDMTYLVQTLKEDFVCQFNTVINKNLKNKQQELEANFNSKNKAFIKAVNNVTIHTHPVLQEIITLFCELDSIPFVPINLESPTTVFPPVDELLKRSDYRRGVPMEYLPLLDLVQLG